MDMNNEIINGNSFELIKQLPDNSINLVITSPPYYNQRDYGAGIGNEDTVGEYIENLLQLFGECVRAIKHTGSIVFNVGDKYQDSSLLLVPYRFAIEASKRFSVKLVNDITWIKLNPTPRQYRRRLVSSTEPFFHFVKTDDYYYNIDGFINFWDNKKRRDSPASKKKKRTGIGQSYFDLIEKSSLSDEEKSNAKQELQSAIQEVKRGEIASLRMKIRGIHALPFGGQEGGRKSQIMKKGFTIIKINGRSLKRDIIESPVEAIKGCKHPAVYPEYLVQEFVKLLTRKDDVVLDPFVGSGTTAVVCKRMGRKYIGFELNPEYCEYAEERLNKTEKQLLFMEILV